MRLGIYGGTFSPPHKGHEIMARAFIESGYIDKLLIIPTFTPPHKNINRCDDPTKRMDMLRLAMCDLISEHPEKIEVSDYEIAKGDVSYTVNTVKHFRELYEDVTVLCGSDMLLTLDSWYKADELLSICNVAYNSRFTDSEDSRELEKKVHLLHATYGTLFYNLSADTMEISSSKIRYMIKNGEPTDEYLQHSVREYIDEHGLYRD